MAKMQIKPKQILSNPPDTKKPKEKIPEPSTKSNTPVEKIQPLKISVKEEPSVSSNSTKLKEEHKPSTQNIHANEDRQDLSPLSSTSPLPRESFDSAEEELQELPSLDETSEALYPKKCIPQETAIYNLKLARAYVPYQKFCTTYMPVESLLKGTVFPELYEPYLESRR